MTPRCAGRKRTSSVLMNGGADGGRDGGVVPESAAGVELAGEHARDVGRRRYDPRKHVLAHRGAARGNHVQREFRAYLAVVELAEFSEGQAVPVGHPGRPDVGLHCRNRALHHPAGRVYVVDHVDCRGLGLSGAHRHQPHHVAGVVEVARAHVLNLHDDGVHVLDVGGTEVDVGGVGGELRA